MYSLEEDWTEIVRNAHMLSEKARSQQQALWELVETEVAYIRTLKVIQDVSYRNGNLVMSFSPILNKNRKFCSFYFTENNFIYRISIVKYNGHFDITTTFKLWLD